MRDVAIVAFAQADQERRVEDRSEVELLSPVIQDVYEQTGMTAADNYDIEIMFHVKHPSFAEAETGEHFVKDRLNIDPAHQTVERIDGAPNLFCHDLGHLYIL